MYKLGSGYTKQEALRACKVYQGSFITHNFDDDTFDVMSDQNPKDMDFWVYQDYINLLANPLKPLELETQIIDTEDSLLSLISYLEESDVVTAWDTETTGLDWQTSDIVGIGVCWGLDKRESAYIPINHWKGTNLETNFVITNIKPYLEDISKEKVFHNAKFDMHMFANYGIYVKGIVFDTIVAHYLVRPDYRHALDIIIREYVDCYVEKYEQVIKKTKEYLKETYKTKDRPHLNKVNISHSSIEWVAEYCGVDVWSTLFMMHKLEEKLATLPNIEKLFYEVEMPLVTTLFDIEREGLHLDEEWYKKTSASLTEQRNRAIEFGHIKYGINIQSPAQVRRVLLHEFDVDVDVFEKTATGEISVNAQILKELKMTYSSNKQLYGFLNVILTNRKTVKMGSTYVTGVYNKKSELTGKLHTTYNQTKTETGRLSSSNPNSQNFPARGKYAKYRGGIIPKPGRKFVGCDFSGCELRFLAHMSGCKAFIDTFVHGMNGGDAHATTAKLIFNLDRAPTKEERFVGKTINFGTIYGMQYQKLSRTLGVSEERAIEIFDLFWSNLPEIDTFVQESWRKAVCLGYTETILGRRRYFEFVSDKLKSYKGKDWRTVDINFERIPSCDSDNLRASTNHRIQGSNADLTKIAMNCWSKILKREHGNISLTIHDEIISSIESDMVDYYIPLKKKCMETSMSLSVPMIVDVHVGNNWRELK